MSGSKQYPDKKGIHLYQEQHVEAVQRALEAAGDQMDSDDSPETERITHIARSYIERSQFDRLADDMRVQEARQVVAKDHNMTPDDVSLVELLKITAGAYCGYQQTSDWEVEDSEKSDDRARVGGDSA